jgi:hypothetical protein
VSKPAPTIFSHTQINQDDSLHPNRDEQIAREQWRGDLTDRECHLVKPGGASVVFFRHQERRRRQVRRELEDAGDSTDGYCKRDVPNLGTVP